MEIKTKGFVSTHRSIEKSEIAGDMACEALFLFLVRQAARFPWTGRYNSKPVNVKIGQYWTTKEWLAGHYHIGRFKLNNCLENLEKCKMIKVKNLSANNKGGILITVVNYHKYQDVNEIPVCESSNPNLQAHSQTEALTANPSRQNNSKLAANDRTKQLHLDNKDNRDKGDNSDKTTTTTTQVSPHPASQREAGSDVVVVGVVPTSRIVAHWNKCFPDREVSSLGPDWKANLVARFKEHPNPDFWIGVIDSAASSDWISDPSRGHLNFGWLFGVGKQDNSPNFIKILNGGMGVKDKPLSAKELDVKCEHCKDRGLYREPYSQTTYKCGMCDAWKEKLNDMNKQMLEIYPKHAKMKEKLNG